MGIRDKEIERLVKYAEGMGVKVVFSNKRNPTDSAEWVIDGSQITIFTRSHQSKTDIILSCLHEISHHVDFIHRNNRQVDEKFEDALTPDDDGETNKRKRKKILDMEKAGTEWWEIVYKETDCKFPVWKLHAQKEYDLLQYQTFYETGDFMGAKERKVAMKEIRNKHRKIKYG